MLFRFLTRITSHLPGQQVVRYLAVGAWNTLFGYATYFCTLWVLNHRLPAKYLYVNVILASLISSVFNVTMAFFCMKFFVFQTRGNYWREWLRCVAVYGSGMLPSLILLPLITRGLRTFPVFHDTAAYIAGAICMALSVVYNFIGHKKFTFRARTAQV